MSKSSIRSLQERLYKMIKYSTSELYYMLDRDTTVSQCFLVENPIVVALVKRCADGFITYETLLDKVNEELYIISTNDYCTNGFENPTCVNCGFSFHIDDMEYESC